MSRSVSRRVFSTHRAQCALDGGACRLFASLRDTASYVADSGAGGGPPEQGKGRKDKVATAEEAGDDVGSNKSDGEPVLPKVTPLSPLENVLATIIASYGALRDPRRADLVSLLGETTGERALRGLLTRMKDSETGRDVLRDRPVVTDSVMHSLKDHAPETFGGAYYRFMRRRDFQADERPPVRTLSDPDLAYVALRVRQVHDFWHVLFDCHTDVVGEASLKVVEFAQTAMPMTGLAVLAAELRLDGSRRQLLNRLYVPWGVRAGGKSADLVTLYYEREFGRPLDELRALWRIECAPSRDS